MNGDALAPIGILLLVACLIAMVTRRFGWPVHEVSTVSREGLRPLTFALWNMVSTYRDAQPPIVPRRPVIRPIPVAESGFTVEPDGQGGFVVRGTRPERWINQTDFDNDEAVGYLGDRLARLGVEDELRIADASEYAGGGLGILNHDVFLSNAEVQQVIKRAIARAD